MAPNDNASFSVAHDENIGVAADSFLSYPKSHPLTNTGFQNLSLLITSATNILERAAIVPDLENIAVAFLPSIGLHCCHPLFILNTVSRDTLPNVK